MPDRLRVVYLVLIFSSFALDGSFQHVQSDFIVLVVLLVMKSFLFWMVWCWISSHLYILFLYLLSLYTLLYWCSKILKIQLSE